MFEKQIKLNKEQKILFKEFEEKLNNAEMLMAEGARLKRRHQKELWESIHRFFPEIILDNNAEIDFTEGIIIYKDIPDEVRELKDLKEKAILANDFKTATKYRDREQKLAMKLKKKRDM